MAEKNLLFLAQLTGYVIAFVLSFCLFVPLIVHVNDFNGHCLLFSEGTWNSTGQLIVSWASGFYCHYAITVGFLLLIMCCVQIYRSFALLIQGKQNSFLASFVEVVVTLLLTIMVLIASVLVTVGFKIWCDGITSRHQSCENASDEDIDPKEHIKVDGFYIQIGTSQFGAWSSWVIWVALAVLSILTVCSQYQQNSMRLSMGTERRRILSESMKAQTYGTLS